MHASGTPFVLGLIECSSEMQSLSQSLQCSNSAIGSVSIVGREKGKDCEKGNRARGVRKLRKLGIIKRKEKKIWEFELKGEANLCDNER